MKMNISAIEDMPNNRLVSAGLQPFIYTLFVEIFIIVHQYNRSIVSAFAHFYVRVKESRICSLTYTLAYIAHRNVMLSKTHTLTDIFDSANIWPGDAVICVIFFSAYLWLRFGYLWLHFTQWLWGQEVVTLQQAISRYFMALKTYISRE